MDLFLINIYDLYILDFLSKIKFENHYFVRKKNNKLIKKIWKKIN